jgi:hypothetical protein
MGKRDKSRFGRLIEIVKISLICHEGDLWIALDDFKKRSDNLLKPCFVRGLTVKGQFTETALFVFTGGKVQLL